MENADLRLNIKMNEAPFTLPLSVACSGARWRVGVDDLESLAAAERTIDCCGRCVNPTNKRVRAFVVSLGGRDEAGAPQGQVYPPPSSPTPSPLREGAGDGRGCL